MGTVFLGVKYPSVLNIERTRMNQSRKKPSYREILSAENLVCLSQREKPLFPSIMDFDILVQRVRQLEEHIKTMAIDPSLAAPREVRVTTSINGQDRFGKRKP